MHVAEKNSNSFTMEEEAEAKEAPQMGQKPDLVTVEEEAEEEPAKEEVKEAKEVAKKHQMKKHILKK